MKLKNQLERYYKSNECLTSLIVSFTDIEFTFSTFLIDEVLKYSSSFGIRLMCWIIG